MFYFCIFFYPQCAHITSIRLIQHVAMAKRSAIANGNGVRLRYRSRSGDRICYCNSETQLPELMNEFYCLTWLSLERNRIAVQTKVYVWRNIEVPTYRRTEVRYREVSKTAKYRYHRTSKVSRYLSVSSIETSPKQG